MMQQYTFVKHLSTTLFGHIDLVRSNDTMFVLKYSNITELEKERSENKILLENPERECELLLSIPSHPNIIECHRNYTENDNYITVLEYANNGDLLNFVQKYRGKEYKEKLKRYFKDICHAVKHIHDNGIAHLDISLENILLSDDTAKLCDFGMATKIKYSKVGEEKLLRSKSSKFGKRFYTAPEIIQCQPYRPTEADVYSLGMVLLISIIKIFPYSRPVIADKRYAEISSVGIVRTLKNWKLVSKFSYSELDFISRTVCERESRMNISDIVNHPYLN